jgi:lysophospholipase L1-like esterase
MKRLLGIVFRSLVAIFAAVAGVFAVEVFMALHGKKEPVFVNPSHSPVHVGDTGPDLIYAVIGDSTGAGRGAPYVDGIAIGTAKHLADYYRVRMTNFSISGAVAGDVLRDQAAPAAKLHPDLVLLSVGANDATHFTPSSRLMAQLVAIVNLLRAGNPRVKIVVTGCPQMGSVPRFQQPLRWFAWTQTARINCVFLRFAAQEDVVWAHIADRTGSIFAKDPSLFADDQFHPNDRGYAVWLPVLDEAIDQALKTYRVKPIGNGQK